MAQLPRPQNRAVTPPIHTSKYIEQITKELYRQLTQSLLKADFNLCLQLPSDRLCPPVPVRWNYIRWIQELLDTTSDAYSDRYDAEREVVGLDIGVGASAIYPLLACSTRPCWRMAGTDIDQHSLNYAKKNVESNGLGKRVRLALSATADAPLIPLEKLGVAELDFVMTNPPFYSSETAMQESYGSKTAPPSAVCTGAANEMICPGGDVGFAARIVEESLRLREQVQWYTVMLGKLASLQQIVATLREHGIGNFAATCLQAGHRTKRWAVGWSFQDHRPRNDVARHGELVHAVLPPPTEHTIAAPLLSAEIAGARVDAALKALDVRWQWRAAISTGVMEARENVWSRAARRKKRFGGDESRDEESEENDDRVGLAVKVVCRIEQVDVRWLRGTDPVLFQSLCGLLKRALPGREQ